MSTIRRKKRQSQIMARLRRNIFISSTVGCCTFWISVILSNRLEDVIYGQIGGMFAVVSLVYSLFLLWNYEIVRKGSL